MKFTYENLELLKQMCKEAIDKELHFIASAIETTYQENFDILTFYYAGLVPEKIDDTLIFLNKYNLKEIIVFDYRLLDVIDELVVKRDAKIKNSIEIDFGGLLDVGNRKGLLIELPKQ